MKYFQASLFVFFLVLCFSCADDPPMDSFPNTIDTIDFGTYYLAFDTKQSFAYYRPEGYANSKIEFVDSVNNRLELHIMGNTEQEESFTSESVVDYNVFEVGDEIHYIFRYEFESYILKQEDQAQFPFYISIRAFPKVPNPDSSIVADILTISSFEDNKSTPAGTLITKILDQRTWSDVPSNDLFIGDLSIFNKSFTEVYQRAESTDWNLYFNLEIGIVAFTDENGTRWRFEKFID